VRAAVRAAYSKQTNGREEDKRMGTDAVGKTTERVGGVGAGNYKPAND